MYSKKKTNTTVSLLGHDFGSWESRATDKKLVFICHITMFLSCKGASLQALQNSCFSFPQSLRASELINKMDC